MTNGMPVVVRGTMKPEVTGELLADPDLLSEVEITIRH